MKYIITIIISLLFINVQGQDSWLIDKNGCKVHNPYPRKRESVEWIGDCIDSIANGNGKLIWYLNGKQTDNVYTGNLKDGKPEGKGKYIFSTGRILEGEFRNGLIHYGKEVFNTGKRDSIVYVGEFMDGLANGKGTKYFVNEEWFTGEFENDYFKSGIYTSKLYGFIIESSDWTYFIPNSGKMTWDDGRLYEGDLKNFVPHGLGTMIHPNGKKVTGKWKKERLIK